MINWSNPRFMNVEYRASTGRMPALARPAAIVIACCSAIPTSMTLSGNSSANRPRPTGRVIAAVMPTTVGSARAMRAISRAKTLVHPKRSGAMGRPVSGWMAPIAWNRSWTSRSAGS